MIDRSQQTPVVRFDRTYALYKLLNFPEPYLHPAPVWSGWELQDNSQHLLITNIYKLVGEQLEEYKQINRDWNSRVPVNWQKIA